LIKIIKERIKKKKRFLRIKNVKSRNYLKIIEVLDEETYIKKKVIKTRGSIDAIEDVFARLDTHNRVYI